MTMVDGEVLVDEFRLSRLDGAEIASDAKQAAREVAGRAGLSF